MGQESFGRLQMFFVGMGSFPVEQIDGHTRLLQCQQAPQFPGGGIGNIEHAVVFVVTHQFIGRADRQIDVFCFISARRQWTVVPGNSLVPLTQGMGERNAPPFEVFFGNATRRAIHSLERRQSQGARPVRVEIVHREAFLLLTYEVLVGPVFDPPVISLPLFFDRGLFMKRVLRPFKLVNNARLFREFLLARAGVQLQHLFPLLD
jgi:hypothetical protein